jgi:hypothetical protein
MTAAACEREPECPRPSCPRYIRSCRRPCIAHDLSMSASTSSAPVETPSRLDSPFKRACQTERVREWDRSWWQRQDASERPQHTQTGSHWASRSLWTSLFPRTQDENTIPYWGIWVQRQSFDTRSYNTLHITRRWLAKLSCTRSCTKKQLKTDV